MWSTRLRTEARLTIALAVDNALPTPPKGTLVRQAYHNTLPSEHGKQLRILPLLTIFSGMSVSENNYSILDSQHQEQC